MSHSMLEFLLIQTLEVCLNLPYKMKYYRMMYYYYYYLIIFSFMQNIHTHIPETNHVPSGYIVAAILSLLFIVPLCLVPALVLLFFYISTF